MPWKAEDEVMKRLEEIAPFYGDVDQACAALQAQGLTIEVPPRTFYWGRSAYLRDPEGRLIELHQPPGG